jgi:hypothetical protein
MPPFREAVGRGTSEAGGGVWAGAEAILVIHLW